MTESLSRAIVAAAARAAGEVPAPVDRIARLHLLDSLAVGALGAARGPLRGLQRMAEQTAGPAAVLGARHRTSPATAALVNGSLIHSLEYDDTHVASVMHGSATLTPAAFAAAEGAGVGGARLVAAYAVGWELLIRLGLASPGSLQARGFQTTSAAGPFAAALVSVLVHGDVEHGVDALGIAGSQPGGTFAFLAAGDTVKAAQPAWAAHAGLLAADLARHGVTGPEQVLDGPFGFYRLYAGDPGAPDRLGREVADLGQRWHLAEAAFKLLPCCHFIHPFVEALQSLVDQGLTADGLASLHCWVPTGAVPVIAEPWAERQLPATGHDVRWSLPYVLATHLVEGRLPFEVFDAPVGGRPAELAARITYEDWPEADFPARFPARIEATLVDGRVLRAEVDDVVGGAGRPVAEDAVLAKARACLELAGAGGETADRLAATLLDTPDFDPGEVLALLSDLHGPD